MKRLALLIAFVGLGLATAGAHGGSAPVTWNREVSRIVFEKCASCHRPDATAFSMLSYRDVQPRANEIKAAVLSRRMPPWGAVKGFGSFRNDQSLSQEQIELVTRWVDGGIRRGNNAQLLPKPPDVAPTVAASPTAPAMVARGTFRVDRAILLDGIVPETVPAGRSIRVTAVTPDGRVEPLVWLDGYDDRYRHPFLFRRPILLPSGTTIQGLPPGASIRLLPR